MVIELLSNEMDGPTLDFKQVIFNLIKTSPAWNKKYFSLLCTALCGALPDILASWGRWWC